MPTIVRPPEDMSWKQDLAGMTVAHGAVSAAAAPAAVVVQAKAAPTDEQAWKAEAFEFGKIPESAPPPEFC